MYPQNIPSFTFFRMLRLLYRLLAVPCTQVLDDKSLELPTSARLQMAVDVAEGMAFLHSREPPLIHRDLKSHNLFVQEGPPSTPVQKNTLISC